MLTEHPEVGQSVANLATVYDRLAPTLYSIPAGSVGEVIRSDYHLGEIVVTVAFGDWCVAVVNARALRSITL